MVQDAHLRSAPLEIAAHAGTHRAGPRQIKALITKHLQPPHILYSRWEKQDPPEKKKKNPPSRETQLRFNQFEQVPTPDCILFPGPLYLQDRESARKHSQNSFREKGELPSEDRLGNACTASGERGSISGEGAWDWKRGLTTRLSCAVRNPWAWVWHGGRGSGRSFAALENGKAAPGNWPGWWTVHSQGGAVAEKGDSRFDQPVWVLTVRLYWSISLGCLVEVCVFLLEKLGQHERQLYRDQSTTVGGVGLCGLLPGGLLEAPGGHGLPFLPPACIPGHSSLPDTSPTDSYRIGYKNLLPLSKVLKGILGHVFQTRARTFWQLLYGKGIVDPREAWRKKVSGWQWQPRNAEKQTNTGTHCAHTIQYSLVISLHCLSDIVYYKNFRAFFNKPYFHLSAQGNTS